jgi:hypothetical protein
MQPYGNIKAISAASAVPTTVDGEALVEYLQSNALYRAVDLRPNRSTSLSSNFRRCQFHVDKRKFNIGGMKGKKRPAQVRRNWKQAQQKRTWKHGSVVAPPRRGGRGSLRARNQRRETVRGKHAKTLIAYVETFLLFSINIILCCVFKLYILITVSYALFIVLLH